MSRVVPIPSDQPEPSDPDATVTVRELWQFKVEVAQQFGEADMRNERRFGRLEKLGFGVLAVIGMPKLAGVDVVDTVQTAVIQAVS